VRGGERANDEHSQAKHWADAVQRTLRRKDPVGRILQGPCCERQEALSYARRGAGLRCTPGDDEIDCAFEPALTVAPGEAVVVNDRFGIRLTDIISPSERLAGLE